MLLLEDVTGVLAATSAEVAAAEDFTLGNPASDVIRLSDHRRIWFIIVKLAGAVGTFTPTIESCDDVSATNKTTIPHKYRLMSTNGTWGAVTRAAAAGVLVAAGANQMIIIEVDAEQLVDRAGVRDQFVRMQLTETDSTALDGCFLALLIDPIYAQETPARSWLS